MDDAEGALAEANIYDSEDPEVWAYLSLVCLRHSRRLEAEQAYRFAMQKGLRDSALQLELARAQEQAGFGNPFLSARTGVAEPL